MKETGREGNTTKKKVTGEKQYLGTKQSSIYQPRPAGSVSLSFTVPIPLPGPGGLKPGGNAVIPMTPDTPPPFQVAARGMTRQAWKRSVTEISLFTGTVFYKCEDCTHRDYKNVTDEEVGRKDLDDETGVDTFKENGDLFSTIEGSYKAQQEYGMSFAELFRGSQ